MQLWAEIFDANGNRLGSGMVWSVTNAGVIRALDGAGSITFSTPGTEARALELLKNERRATLFRLDPSGRAYSMGTKREVGSGIIRNRSISGNESRWTLSVDGPDSLDELKRENVLLARMYNAATLQTIVNDLTAQAGWTALVNASIASQLLSVRLDGTSILKALQAVCSQKGYHLRQGLTARQVEIAPMGQSSGVRLVNASYVHPALYDNANVMLISSISVKESSEGMFNWLLPVGGGTGKSKITLEYATQNTPYAVKSTVMNGETVYYIEDTDSIAKYGRIQKVGTFKNVTPLSNSDADQRIGSNALQDYACVALQRSSKPQVTYTVTVKNVRRNIRPGDKVRLIYKGFIHDEKGRVVNYLDVNEDVWVIRASETYSQSGVALSLTVSTIDKMEESTAQVIVGALESISINDLRVQPYPSNANYTYWRTLDNEHAATIPVNITNGVLYLNQCRLKLISRPFRVTAKAASASDVVTSSAGGAVPTTSSGGLHRHLVLKYQSALSDFHDDLQRNYLGARSSGAQDLTVQIGAGPDTSDVYTFDADGSHSHTINIPAHTHTVPALLVDFGIEDDSQLPDTVRVKINGVDQTIALGGPWGVGGFPIEIELDITDFLINASGGLRQLHQVEISCTDGQGEVEAAVELRQTVQSIAVV